MIRPQLRNAETVMVPSTKLMPKSWKECKTTSKMVPELTDVTYKEILKEK